MTAPATMTLSDRLATQVAMGFGIGRSPKAPGTFGSLPGLMLGSGFQLIAAAAADCGNAKVMIYIAVLAACNALLIAVAWWSITRTERVLNIHDDQRIVIDEVAGQALAVAAAPLSWSSYVLAFLLFRFFDIVKPGPIGYIDRHIAGTAGTLCDDLLAGVAAGLVLLGVLYALGPNMLSF